MRRLIGLRRRSAGWMIVIISSWELLSFYLPEHLNATTKATSWSTATKLTTNNNLNFGLIWLLWHVTFGGSDPSNVVPTCLSCRGCGGQRMSVDDGCLKSTEILRLVMLTEHAGVVRYIVESLCNVEVLNLSRKKIVSKKNEIRFSHQVMWVTYSEENWGKGFQPTHCIQPPSILLLLVHSTLSTLSASSYFLFSTQNNRIMAPSASKQKRLAEKAAKQSSKVKNGDGSTTGTSTTTPSGSVNGGSSVNTPLTSRSAATSTENLNAMEKLQLATDRFVTRIGRKCVHTYVLMVSILQERCWCLSVRRQGEGHQNWSVYAVVPRPTTYRGSGDCVELWSAVWVIGRKRFREGKQCVVEL